jgi:hypothetical protein
METGTVADGGWGLRAQLLQKNSRKQLLTARPGRSMHELYNYMKGDAGSVQPLCLDRRMMKRICDVLPFNGNLVRGFKFIEEGDNL